MHSRVLQATQSRATGVLRCHECPLPYTRRTARRCVAGDDVIEVFSDDFFEKDTSAHRPIQYLSERTFELENGELIAVSSLTVSGGKRVGQSS